MDKVRTPFKYAGETVKIKADVENFGGEDYKIEDYWENVYGNSWMRSYGNPAALEYAVRRGTSKTFVPADNEVVYGKLGGLGKLFHVSELELPV